MNHSESQKSSAPVATGDYLRCSTCGAETSLRAWTPRTDAPFVTYCANCWRKRNEGRREFRSAP